MNQESPRPTRGPGRPRHETPSDDYVRRREDIIAAASDLFRAKGYEASLDDVALALDLRKGSLYYYINSKGELLYLIFDRAISLALARIEDLAVQGGSPRERLEALIRHQTEVITNDLSMFSVFFDQRPHLGEDHEVAIRSKERRYIDLYEKTIIDAIADGALGDVHPRYAGQVVLGAATWAYKWFDPERHDPDALADTLVGLLLR